MTSKTVWFGTESRMNWVPAPLPGVDRSLSKWRTSGQYLNGGFYQSESATGGRKVQLQWPTMTGEKVRKLTTYFEGTYGPGPFYYSDPFAEGVNSAPQWLAVPWLAVNDGPSLRGLTRPLAFETPANSFDYPPYGALYGVAGPGELSVKLPIPDGYTAHIGAHGEATGTSVLEANGAALTLLGVTTSTLTNTTIAGPGFVTLQLDGTGEITLYGIIVCLKPTGQPAPIGNFVKGEGHTGLKLENDPMITGYSSAQDRQAVVANFLEVGAWE